MIQEIAKRRALAIISHPDAGKTSLTEKLLLYGGAIQEAGSVRAGKKLRHSTSDWMDLERKRGISITSTLLQFSYQGYHVNLLDTPGHSDFSEDTYRVLTAVDAAIVLIDSAKGVESQTRKLVDVAIRRKIPIFIFFNKYDRPARDALDLLEEIERTLRLPAFPMTWPLGAAADFKGLYDRIDRRVHRFEVSTGSGTSRNAATLFDPQDPRLQKHLDAESYTTASTSLDLLDGAGERLDPNAIRRGDLVPVYFGSALKNFGG